MYSDKGPKVVFGGYGEYDAEFTLDCTKQTEHCWLYYKGIFGGYN